MSITGRTPICCSAAIASAAVSRGASAIATSPAALPSRGDVHDRASLAGQRLGALGQPVEGDVLPFEQARVAERDPMALHRGDRAVAGARLEAGRPRRVEPAWRTRRVSSEPQRRRSGHAGSGAREVN